MRQANRGAGRSPARGAIIVLGAAFFFAGLAFLGCEQMPPIDLRFDSSAGADWAPPVQDAGVETEPNPDATGPP